MDISRIKFNAKSAIAESLASANKAIKATSKQEYIKHCFDAQYNLAQYEAFMKLIKEQAKNLYQQMRLENDKKADKVLSAINDLYKIL